MLISFGAAWPASIYKSYVSRENAGKSILFLWIVFAGYVFGIIHKLVFSYDIVIYLYALNGVMVMADILLYYRNKMNTEK
ncbi:MAG: hypothetical protein A4E55_01491 [Pelotomaculum sp. PtaU1.Bin035]|nr:MAG: hypothetical protein A4E55_01491 [Pelotomaculum sp. PtaU1.Bin035]